MIACVILAVYLGGGVWMAARLLPEKPPLLRFWLGTVLGLVLWMWLPALWAFAFTFGMLSQGLSLGTLALLCAAVGLLTPRGIAARHTMDAEEEKLLRLWFWTVMPLAVLSFYLQYTHTLRPVNGALHVGQSTYGDLCLHLSIATSLRNASFPPEYALLPGTRLAYPFLADALSTSFLLWGMPLRWSIIIPGTLMMIQVYTGILLLAHRMTGSRNIALWTLLLLVFCGGLGFLYDWDMVGTDPWKLEEIFKGYYKTPANQPEYNLRWSNLLADLWVPQRTFLGGWVLLIPALYLLLEALETRRVRDVLLLAFLAGAMPLVHTHSFLALGLFSGGILLAKLLRETERGALIRLAGLYLGVTLALALPQLLAFTFPQSASQGFVRFQFNWVNNSGGRGLIDTYLYFWIKNVGPPMLLMLLALLDLPSEQRPTVCGAFAIFVVAELILFQPNEYEINMLFYVWYLMMLPVTLQYGVRLFRRMAGLRARWPMAALFLALSMLSGGLSVAREASTYSDYVLIGAPHVALAGYVESETPPDAIFMTATHHNNAVSALTGRRVVCGPDLYLHFHGLDYLKAEADVRLFYTDPAANRNLLEAYGVQYIVLGDYERSMYRPPVAEFDELFPLLFEADGLRLYAAE